MSFLPHMQVGFCSDCDFSDGGHPSKEKFVQGGGKATRLLK
jgi:hypothetical protein